jgi:hypothetical protein
VEAQGGELRNTDNFLFGRWENYVSVSLLEPTMPITIEYRKEAGHVFVIMSFSNSDHTKFGTSGGTAVVLPWLGLARLLEPPRG